MKQWQIGIARIVGDKIDWQEDFVAARTYDEASVLATIKGYYRNLRLRTVD